MKKSKWMLVLVLLFSVFSFVPAGQVNAQEPVQIEFWYGLGSEAGQKMEELIKEFNASQSEVKVVGVAQADYSETMQKVQAGMAANKVPGAFIGERDTMLNFVNSDALAEITPLIGDSEVFKEEDFVESFYQQGQVDGKQFSVPSYGTTQVMYFNTKVFEEAGVNPDEAFKSWENLAEASKKIKESGAADLGHMIMWGADNLSDLALSNGGTFLSEDGKTVLINSPEWVEAWEFARKMIHEEKTMGVISGGQGWEYWYKTIDAVMAGQSSSYTGSSGDKGNLDFSYIDSRVQPGLNGNDPKPVAEALQIMIPKQNDEAHQKAAFKWIEFFTSPEVSGRWSSFVGYIPVRKATMEEGEYAEQVKENPYLGIPYQQALNAASPFDDPTGGVILDELTKAADKVELENVPAQEALDAAAKKSQEALDKALKN